MEPTGFPSNGAMSGGTGSVADLVKDTKRGILVTRLWYIRAVDRQTLLVTGLTRDGTFFIENGDSIFKYFIDGLFFTFGGKVIF